MGYWPSIKAKRLYRALLHNGWQVTGSNGSHVKLSKAGQQYTYAFHDSEEIGPKMIGRIAKELNLNPNQL